MASHAVASLIHGVLPAILPMCLLDAMPAGRYAALLVVGGLVQVAAVPLLSPASDRFGPARVVLFGEMCFAALLAVALTLVARGSSDFLAWSLYFGASGAITGLLIPAQGVMVQHLTDTRTLERALSWESVAQTVGRLTGPVAAATALALATPVKALGWVFALWLFTWAVHVVVLLRLAKEASSEPTPLLAFGSYRDSIDRWLADIRAGARVRWRLKTERWLVIQASAELLFIVPAFGFCLALAIHHSNWPISSLGWTQASCGAGLVLANAFGEQVCRRVDRWWLSQLSGYGVGLGLMMMSFALTAQSLVLLAFAAFFANLCLGIRIFCGRAQRRVALPRAWLARFAAIHVVLNTLAAQTGIALGALADGKMELTTWYALAGLIILPLTWSTRWIPGWRALLSCSPDQAQGRYEREWPEAFRLEARPGKTKPAV